MSLYKRLNSHKTDNSDASQPNVEMNTLAVVYEENFDVLLNFGRKYCREESVIEDAIQNIFIKLINSRETFVNIRNIKQYLLVALRNELFSLFSKEKQIVTSEISPNFQFNPEYSVEDKIIKEDGEARIKKCLKKSLLKLTHYQQEVLYLKYDLGLSYEEISETLNITVQSCRTSIYRSIKIIKADLESLKQKNIQIFFCFLRTIF
jgi:RNA polymerase sigma factor (sigma-70 family)